jgi:hypothetical protein
MLRTLFVAATLAWSTAHACGVCVEDKIASTYDHALVTRAVAMGLHVAFFHLDGDAPHDEATRRSVLEAAEGSAMVLKGSARVSVDTMTLSFAFDPSRARLIDIQSRIDRKLAARKLTLFPMKVIERQAEFKAISRK